jgi:RimJ/RimL family protein N-acetyltransferase
MPNNLRYHIEELKTLNDNDFIDISTLIDVFYEKYDLKISKTRIEKIINNLNKKLFIVRARLENSTEKIIAIALFSAIQTLCLDKALISELIILPEYRQQGIARELFKHCIKISKEKAVDVIELIVHRDNINAISLYKSLGFDFSKYDYMRYIVLEWPLKDKKEEKN